jgi:hypothetical protein
MTVNGESLNLGSLNIPSELKRPRDLGQMACGAKGVLCGRRKTPVS